MGTHIKRLIFLIHRWLGVILCVFFAMWFVSGVVMMYVGYPKLTDAERLQHLPALSAEATLLAPQQVLARAGVTGPLRELRLSTGSGGQAAYFAVVDHQGIAAGGRKTPGSNTVVIDARTGSRVPVTDQARAMASAAAFAEPGIGLRYLDTIEEDAFTHSRTLDAHRPLHRVELHDADATMLYVSGRTGEVVRDASQSERFWNYTGAWIHWLYPFRGNVFDRYWTDIVNWLSIVGIAMAVSGTIVGIMRWRFARPYRSGARTPYQGFQRWHHIGGMLFAVVTITWIFSGLMSMNPWRIFDVTPVPLQMEAFDGGALQISADDAAPVALLASTGSGMKELRWAKAQEKTIVLAYSAAGKPTVLDSRNGQPFQIDPTALEVSAARLLPHPLQRIELLTAYDIYYYSRDAHATTGGATKPLPVLCVKFADPHESWIYIDPHTGSVVGRSDQGKRWSRWLFAMLHSWDWLPLLERRPLWDLVLITLSLGGAVMSLTGIVIGWRRLGKKLRSLGA